MTYFRASAIQRAARALLLGAALAYGQTHAAPPIAVAVVAVKPQAVPTGFEVDGVVQPVRQSTLSAQASGRISSNTSSYLAVISFSSLSISL